MADLLKDKAKENIEKDAESFADKDSVLQDEAIEVLSVSDTEEEASAPSQDDGKKKKKARKQSLLCDIFDSFETFCHALVLMMILFVFVFRFVTVDGRSMNNTLADQDKLVISNLFYSPSTGDIVVLNAEGVEGLNQHYIIKRIIATGGQDVSINFDTWDVTVDGKTLDESYVNREVGRMRHDSLSGIEGVTFDEDGVAHFTVPKGQVFVMGDNRQHSTDSRLVGYFEEERIMGRVLLRIAPSDAFGRVK